MLYELITIKREFGKVISINFEVVPQKEIYRLVDTIPLFRRAGGKEIYSHNRLLSVTPGGGSSLERTWRIIQCGNAIHDKTISVEELKPILNKDDSFDGYALILRKENGVSVLRSCGKIVAKIIDGSFYIIGNQGNNTMKHIREWLYQEGFCIGEKKAFTKKQLMEIYGNNEEDRRTEL